MDFSLLICVSLSLWLLPCFLLPCNVLCQKLKQRKVHTESLYSFKIPSMQKTLWTPIQRLSNLASLWSHLLELFTPKTFYVCGCTTQISCCSGGGWSLQKGRGTVCTQRTHDCGCSKNCSLWERREKPANPPHNPLQASEFLSYLPPHLVPPGYPAAGHYNAAERWGPLSLPSTYSPLQPQTF